MNCAELEILICDYVDGTIDAIRQLLPALNEALRALKPCTFVKLS